MTTATIDNAAAVSVIADAPDAAPVSAPVSAPVTVSDTVPGEGKGKGKVTAKPVTIKAGDVVADLVALQKRINDAKAAAGRVNAAAIANDGAAYTTRSGDSKNIVGTRHARSNGGERKSIIPESVVSQLLAAGKIKKEDAAACKALNKLASALADIMAL